MTRAAFTLVELLVVIAIIGILCCCLCGGEPLPSLLFGWAIYLYRVAPMMQVEPAAFAVGGAAMVLAIAGTQRLGSWFYRHTRAEFDPKATWRFRWTLAGVFLVLFLFLAGIALIGTFHETYWLFSSNQPIMEGGGSSAARRSMSMNNLKQIGLGCHNYEAKHHRLPPGGTFNPYGEAIHSWETHLLPYLENPARPDLSLPWDHPDNARHFQTKVQVLLHPGFRGQHDADAAGYALSHYAVNSRVMRGNIGLRFEDATDGLSNTILAGEVPANFRPWGDPVNWRDPADGINASPDGFGGPPRQLGAQFLLMDGSVRFLDEKTDPEVLKALATPAAGDKLDSGKPN